MSYSYWEIFYNYEIPLWERIALAGALPVVAPFILFANCLKADREERLPEATDATEGVGQPDVYKEPDTCTPEGCKGLIDKSRSKDDKYLCISFASAAEVGLTSDNKHWGIELADIDGNGVEDVYLLNSGAPNQFFTYSEGKFIDRSKDFGLAIGGDSRAAAFGDYDSDGDKDLLLAGDSGSRLYVNQNGLFGPSESIQDPDAGLAAIWLGADLLLATENGTRFYHYTGQDSFVEDAVESGLYDPGSGAAFAVTDYNKDGLSDVYLANVTGKNRFFVNLGNGTYESLEDDLNIKGEYGQSTDAAWAMLEPDDDRASLYVANWDAANLLYIYSGEKYEDKAADFGLQEPGNTTCARWSDFLDEGFPGLFLCRYGQMNLLYQPQLEKVDGIDHVKSYQNIAYPSGMAVEAATVDAAWLDFDRDGRLDLIAVTEAGAIYVYHNETHWVKGCE